MIAVQWALIIGAAISLTAYVCRLDKLRWSKQKPSVIVLHTCLAISSAWAGFRGWENDYDLGNVAALIAALAWIVMSLPTWRDSFPPEHLETAPTPLGSPELTSISGGRKP